MRIRELQLETSRLQDIKAFYGGQLGLPVVQSGRNSFAVQVGSSTVEFSTHAGQAEPFYHFAFNIPENKQKEAMRWLESRGMSPTPDVIDTVNGICGALGEKIWKGAGDKQFTAVGDEHGLLIVVHQHRRWFPVQKRAGIFPVQVVVEGRTPTSYTVPGLPYRFEVTT